MAFCHIYARRDGTFTVRMCGKVSVGDLKGTCEYTSREMATEQEARSWIRDGRQYAGLDDMPEPTVIRRSAKAKA